MFIVVVSPKFIRIRTFNTIHYLWPFSRITYVLAVQKKVRMFYLKERYVPTIHVLTSLI